VAKTMTLRDRAPFAVHTTAMWIGPQGRSVRDRNDIFVALCMSEVEAEQLAAALNASYYDGARHALHRFAWWRDGVEYVGSTGYTLEKAMADVDAAEAEGRSYSL